MKIGDFSTASANISNSMDKSQEQISKSLERIAAERAISSTDGSSLAIADSLTMEASTLTQGVRNVNDGIGMLQIADSTLSTVNDSANRINELSVRMNNATLNSDQKAMIHDEVNRLKTSMSDSINNASYNGKNLFNGTLEFSTGNSTIGVSLNAPAVSSVNVDDQDSIYKFMQNVDGLRGSIGSTINQMVSTSNANMEAVVNLRAAESNLQHNDVAQNYNELNSGFLKNNAGLYAQSMNVGYLRSQMSALLD